MLMITQKLVVVAVFGIALLLSATVASIAQQTSCPASIKADDPGEMLIACINDLRQQVVPSGAVMAFATTCPKEGWTSYNEADGRFILGVGTGPLKQFVGLHTEGGEEEVTLKLSQMPKHQHLLPVSKNHPEKEWGVKADTSKGNWTGTAHRSSDFRGGSKPHNNMPPYIALYFCKKD